MEKMRVGIIGIGFIGAAHIEALRRLGYVDVVALADAQGAEEKAVQLYVPKGYSDYKEMLERENLDAVHICTPNFLHYEMAMAAMKRGIHVMVEKPFTVTLEEAEKLAAYAEQHHILSGVNHTLRMFPQVAQMKALVDKGDVGDIYAVHGCYLQDWLFLDTDWSWRLEPAMSGKTRAFSDIGSHWIDMVENIIGQKAVELLAEFEIVHKTRKKPLKEVETFSGMALRPEDYEEKRIETEDWCTILFRFEKGAIGCVNVSQVTAGRKNQQIIEISGSKCSMKWDSEDSNELWIGRRETYNQKVAKDPSLVEPKAKEVIGYPGGHVEGFPDTFKMQFHKFYQAIQKQDGGSVDYATFRDGVREMYVNDKVYESAQKRSWVKL
ncbi:MAG: Gfo/Idh/MocA family oxidoreductase [Alphaproteobacteria bacterium]|nr:Gfo/Idh/MocA family oxidoreductase [Alphaproteobacteria bacterium]